jgi:hypothetical protein
MHVNVLTTRESQFAIVLAMDDPSYITKVECLCFSNDLFHKVRPEIRPVPDALWSDLSLETEAETDVESARKSE